MKVNELFSAVRMTLQDNDKTYWDDSELLAYYNECVRSMAAERLENKTTATLILDPVKNVYDTSGILRYIRCQDDNGLKRPLYPDDESGEDDVNGVIIQDYNRVYVTDPSVGSVLTLNIVALPEEGNITSNVRIGDENALRYYILSKAYEKDSDMENFQKSSYFYSKYMELFTLLRKSSSVNYSGTEDFVSSYYY